MFTYRFYLTLKKTMIRINNMKDMKKIYEVRDIITQTSGVEY